MSRRKKVEDGINDEGGDRKGQIEALGRGLY